MLIVKKQNVTLEILRLFLGLYNLSLMTFSPDRGCPNVSDFYFIDNSPFQDYSPLTIGLHDRQLLLGLNHVLTILKVRLTVENDPD